jgi:hypothetical protein
MTVLYDVMAVARWLTQHDVRSSVTIPTEKKPRSDVPERTTITRAVTIIRAELKLAPAVAAEATRNALPFNSIVPRPCARAPGWHEMQFLFTEA